MSRRLLRFWSATLLLFAVVLGTPPAHAVEIVDVIGRKTTLGTPVKRIVLGFYFEDFLAVGGPAALDRVVGISRAAWEDWRPDNWKAHVAAHPALAHIADVGEVEVNTFSVEKVLALKPDVVILGDWQVKGIGADFERILAARIPVVVIDYHAQTLERHVRSTLVLGQVLGTEERAHQIADEYETAIRQVQSRVQAANRPKPSVYIELGNKGVAEHGPSYGNFMWGTIADVAGGNNVSRNVVATWGPVSPEFVLTARPEVIVLSGSEWRKNPTSILMGQGVGAEEARARLAGFTRRPGWANLPAVRSGRVHGVYQGASRTIMDYTSVQYLAKALYPDLFADFDPQANYLSFYKRYLPIVPEGTFMISLQ
jgi:iron complex transport system substrate-binding protein